MDDLPDPIFDSLLTDDMLDGIADDLASAALGPGEAAPTSSSKAGAGALPLPPASVGEIAGIIRVPLLFPTLPSALSDFGAAGHPLATAPAPAPKHLAITFINTPKALFLSMTIVKGPVPPSVPRVTTPSSSSSLPRLPTRNLVVATPAPSVPGSASSPREPSVSCLMVEDAAEEPLLEGLARRFCSKLGRMILLACDFGVSTSSAAGGDDGMGMGMGMGLSPLEERKAHSVALQTMAAMLV